MVLKTLILDHLLALSLNYSFQLSQKDCIFLHGNTKLNCSPILDPARMVCKILEIKLKKESWLCRGGFTSNEKSFIHNTWELAQVLLWSWDDDECQESLPKCWFFLTNKNQSTNSDEVLPNETRDANKSGCSRTWSKQRQLKVLN